MMNDWVNTNIMHVDLSLMHINEISIRHLVAIRSPQGINSEDYHSLIIYIYIYEGCPSKSWTLQIYQKPNVTE